HRSDLFSLGVVLYELTTSRLPFTGGTTMEVFKSILNDEPAPMARFNHDVPDALTRVVRKLLDKDRERRYQSAQEVWGDLKRIREGGAEPSDSAVVAAVIRRHRVGLGVGVVALAGLAAALVLIPWRG